ncbi:MAG: histidine kinase dimerization/phospho-acceptor domain-containing protein, partial [Candidatus Saccharibacteria bacterium]
MEVSQVPKLASHFWPKFLKQKITIVVIVQFVLSIIVGVALVCTNTLPIDSIILWTIVISLLLLGTISSLLILISVTKPTKDLLAAVLSVSGEKSSLTPPNPNNEAYERSGFRDALQTIYELSNKDNGLKSTSNEDQSDSELHTISNALNMTICGFIALDKDRNIIYCNKSAPTHIDNDGKKIIDLLFNGNDTLDVWLDSCKNNSVHAERTWTRVPDRLPNLEDRRFFDVLASYEKGVDVETVLTLIDRTSSYIVDEENLDFISFAAHELRGPITVIRGYLDVLNDELSSVFVNDQQELFNRLIVSSNRLSGYV